VTVRIGLRQAAGRSFSDKKKQELFKEFQAKTQEGVSDRERREYLQRRNAALNEKMVQSADAWNFE
jgi:hypothetical protein